MSGKLGDRWYTWNYVTPEAPKTSDTGVKTSENERDPLTGIYTRSSMETLLDIRDKSVEAASRNRNAPSISAFYAPVTGNNGTVTTPEANSRQEGGDHYLDKPIQPWDYITSNGLGFLEGNIVKYVSRYKDKNCLEDLKKAKHYLDKLIETLEGK